MGQEVRDQARLSLWRSVEFSVRSIRHRILRCAVTLSVIVLAVAFLMNILSETMITTSVARGVKAEFERLYLADLFERRVSRPSTADLVEELSRLKPSEPRWRELQGWSGLAPVEFEKVANNARRERKYGAFFEELNVGRRRVLVKSNEGQEIFDYLAGAENFAAFAAQLKTPEMAPVAIPGEFAEFERFARDWRDYRGAVAQVEQGLQKALEGLEKQLGQPLEKALERAAGDSAARAPLLDAMKQAGFAVEQAELDRVCADLHTLLALRKLRDYLQEPEFRNTWSETRVADNFSPETLLRHYPGNETVRGWLKQRAEQIAQRTVAPLPCSMEELARLASAYRGEVESAGRTQLRLDSPALALTAAQRELIKVLGQPEWAAKWPMRSSEEYSPAAVLWHFSQDALVRRHVGQRARELKATLPCKPEEIRALSDSYRLQVAKYGIAQLPLEKWRPAQPVVAALAKYLNEVEFALRWDELDLGHDFSPEAALLYCSGDERSPRVRNYVSATAQRLATRSNARFPLTDEEMKSVAELERQRTAVRALQGQLAQRGSTQAGISERVFWLIVVSFIVCVVGIANAMLMAVTERFREIATIKCLGALDDFILKIFLIESGLQGLIGALAGVVLGLVLAIVRCWHWFGWAAFQHFPFLDVFGNMGVSVAAGMVLAMLAAVYPAWVASRMAPMEAMRVE